MNQQVLLLAVEVCQKASSAMPRDNLATLVTHLLQANPQWYQHDGILPLDVPSENQVSLQLIEHVEKIRVCPVGGQKRSLFFWAVTPDLHFYKLHSSGPAEDDEADDGVPTFLEWELPAKYVPVSDLLKPRSRNSCFYIFAQPLPSCL